MKIFHTRRIVTVWLVVALSLTLALAPGLAEARAGGGSSSGSRGSRTYMPNRAAPMQRSMTQPTPMAPAMQQRPQVAPTPGFNQGPMNAAPPSSFGRNLMAGMAGGFLGAGLFSLFSGGNRAHATPDGAVAGQDGAGAGFAKFMSILLQIALIGGLVWLVWLVWRFFARRRQGNTPIIQPRFATADTGARPFFGGSPASSNGAPSNGPWGGQTAGYANNEVVQTRPINVGEADEAKFAQVLVDVQNAWSQGDINKLRRFMTPEMVMYFSDELSSLASRGLQNRIEDVAFVGGQVEEAWNEEGRDYATARIQFRAKDYTVSMDDENRIVQGSKTTPVDIEEVWTFVRASGGNWIVSAIQQV
ncbi:MAG: TIM44-like domain-containing protein [Alphaproteobacteria bacterium]|nr:TIM44-like domain-containing protein [Alphaproteobacteria bacterium]